MVIVLSDDILVDIFTKLPLKTLSRLKCISKAWYRIISDECIKGRQPLVVAAIFHHPTTSYSRYGSVLGNMFAESDLTKFPFRSSLSDLTETPFRSSVSSTLVDSSNGLLLFVTGNVFHVCSPVTNRCTTLPLPPKWVLISVLAFDPYRSPHYKVLSFTGWEPRGAHLVVFSSDSGKWVEHEIQWAGLDNEKISANMRYFNGALHILAYPSHMVRVDLDTMACQKFDLPAPISHFSLIGNLGCHVSYATSKNGVMKIWVMDNDKWMLKHSIQVACEFKLLGFNPEKEVVYISVEGKMLGYDVERRVVEGEWEMKGEMERANFNRVFVFPNSRNLLDCMTDLE